MKLLPVGQRLSMHIQGATVKVGVPAQVQESGHLDECVLTFPTLLYPTSGMVYGAPVTLRFTTPQGLHQIDASIMSFTRNMPIEATLGDFRAERTTQRRAYFRAQVSLPVVMAILASKTSKLGLQDRRAVMVDIGGGGLRLDSVLCPAVDDRVAVRVEVPLRLQKVIAPFLQCEAVVMRVEPVSRGDIDRFRLAVRFLVRREIERDPWVRLTLDIQRSDHDDAPAPEPPRIEDAEGDGGGGNQTGG